MSKFSKIYALLLCSLLLLSAKTTFPPDGEELFEGHCTDCHARDLRKNSIGPALGNLHLQRERTWLIKFIYDSQTLIQNGDKLANCVYKTHSKKLMPAFRHLEKPEIEAILDYLEQESKRQKIGKEELNFPCANR